MIAKHFLVPATKLCTEMSLWPVVKRTLYNKVKLLEKDCTEVEIKVPWGKVAGKLWGDENEQPLLAIHGWQDNAGSFDPLAPLLLKNAPVLAIDLPGHGLSSWMHPGSMYHDMDYLLIIQRLKKHFGWDKVKLLAHSMSVQISFWHAVVFPNDTAFVIALDCLKFPSVNVERHSNLLAKEINKFFKQEELDTLPVGHTEDEALKRWISGTNNSLDEKSCRILMKRGVVLMENGKYNFTRDPTLKVMATVSDRTHEHVLQMVKLVRCPFLTIKAEDSPYFEDKMNFLEAVDVMKETNKDFQYVTIPGKHHVHMTHAEDVAAIVNPFLEKYNR